jgi:hypothetical protein
VLDALDEALRPKEVVDLLLLPLIRAHTGKLSSVCRLLIGTRSGKEEFNVLLGEARTTGSLRDLDLVPADTLREDLAAYANRFLESSPLYDQAGMRLLREQLASTIADKLTKDHPQPDGKAAGAFLVAGLYMHHLLTRARTVTPEEVGQEVPRTLGAILELHLAQLGDPWLRPILAAIAYGKHPGMPANLVRLVAPALATRPIDLPPTPPSAKEVARLLDRVGFYLSRTPDVDGTTLYRLFHQGLAEYLQRHPVTAVGQAS